MSIRLILNQNRLSIATSMKSVKSQRSDESRCERHNGTTINDPDCHGLCSFADRPKNTPPAHTSVHEVAGERSFALESQRERSPRQSRKTTAPGRDTSR